ncbi:MAG: ribonuclease H-like domain-containing protein [Dermatophilaceae bacterium]
MRVLVIDIETSPNQAYVWGLWNQNVGLSQLQHPGEVIAFAAKWVGRPKIHFASVYHHGKQEMLDRAHALLSEADIVVTYNGVKFDMPWLRTEFAVAGMPPPSPWVDVDLCALVKRTFRFPSNKLAYVTQALGLETKEETGGFQLWLDCMTGAPAAKKAAWAKMKSYNTQDVVVTEQLMERIRPHVKTFPVPSLYHDSSVDVCRCGSEDLAPQGYSYTALSKFQRYRCRECGAWSRGAKALARIDVRPAR